MTAPGYVDTTFLTDSVEPLMRSTVYLNTFIFDDARNGGLFQDRPNRIGNEIKIPLEYSFTSNAGTFSYDDPMKDPESASGVFMTFNKDAFDDSVRVYKLLEAYAMGEGERVQGSTLADAITNDPKFQRAARALANAINTTCLSDMETMVDSSGNFSDANLSRATYGLASYEYAAGSAVLTRTMLEDTIAALMSTTYGEASFEDLLIYAPLGQWKRITRFAGGNTGTELNDSNFPMTVAADGSGAIDSGRMRRTTTFEGIPVIVVPGMTTTITEVLRKGTWGRYKWLPFEMEDKSAGVLAYQKLYNFVQGVNVLTDMPSWNAKISGLTA